MFAPNRPCRYRHDGYVPILVNLDFVSFCHTLRTLLHRHRVGIEAVVVVVVASMWGIALLSSRKRAWVRACICGCMRQIYKYSDAFSSACSTISVVIAG